MNDAIAPAVRGEAMRSLKERPLVLEYRGPRKRDPLAYWISPRAFFHLLLVLGFLGIPVAAMVPRFLSAFVVVGGYLCVVLAIFVWKVELRD